MRTSRIITGLVATGLVGLTPLAVSAPAEAAGGTWGTTIAITPSESRVVYGDDLWITGTVATGDATGDTWLYGTVTLLAMPAGATTWTTVATDDTYGSFSFYDVKPSLTTAYKVVFSDTDPDTYAYAASESPGSAVGVQRKVRVDNRRTTFFGKVTPDYAHRPVKVERRFGRQWRTHKIVRTDARGRWSIRLPAPSRRKTHWRFTVKSDSSYLGWQAQGWTVRY